MPESLRIGYLRDVVSSRGHDYGGNALRLVIDEANAAGGIGGARVELVERAVTGPAFGTAGHVEATVALWRAMVDDGLLGIIGPSTTPCVLAVHDLVERAGIPQIHWAGTDRACGDWHFQFQAGYLPDEGRALAFLLTRLGHRRVVCFSGEGDYGRAYLDPFVAGAQAQGIEVMARIGLSHTASDVGGAVAEAAGLGADAVVAMGLLGVGDKLVAAMRAAGWRVACFGNCGFALLAAGDDAMRALFDGWTATDMYDPLNATAITLFDRYEARHGVRPNSATACFGHDLGRLMLEGLRLAPAMTRSGLCQGLEAVRNLPSATGGAGSYMTLSARDRQALKGPRLFVFNRITESGLELLPA